MIFTALILLGVGCQSEEIPPVGEDERNVSEDSDEMRTFSLIASMPEESGSTSSIPDESGSTRIAFFQVGKSVALIWEEGDQLDLLFVQGITQVKQTVTVSNIYAEGKKAAFEFTLPAAIQAGYFDLYGVYGGGGLSDSNPSLAVLPLINGSAPSLTSLAAGKKFMMVFSKNRLTTTSPQASVTFRHVGSLFCLTLKNARGTALENLGSIRLGSSISRWAYNNSATEPHYYNLVDDAFRNPESAGNFITLYADGNVATNDTLNFWGWYPTLPDVNWPGLTLTLLDNTSGVLGVSSNVKPARTSPTAPGKNYHFYAVWDDAGLQFTDHTYGGVFDFDGNFYSTVVIGNQVWMAENLKTTHYNDGTPIPNVVSNSEWRYLSTGAYAWYENDEATYKNAYGALYNGYAVNTGKLCPTGWHVPTDAEWTTLITYAGGENVAGGKLKSTRTAPDDAHPRWQSPNTDATDAYGFSAFPGGRRYYSDGSFYSVGDYGYWWSSTAQGLGVPDNWYRYMLYNYGGAYRSGYSIKYGLSVRCLRD